MHKAVDSLNEREVEVLRLLLGGHCAKSVAQQLGLSVHTVNERLRHARRKLGVSTSREAARMLVEAEGEAHKIFVGAHPLPSNSVVANGLEVPPFAGSPHPFRSERGEGSQISLSPFTGGIFVMALIAATVILTNLLGSPTTVGAGQLELVDAPEATSVDAAASSPSPQPVTFGTLPVGAAAASAQVAQRAPAPVRIEVDLMPIADTNGDGSVSPEEYRAFSQQGWTHVSSGSNEVRHAELNGIQRMAFVGIMPNADGVITKEMYEAAIPARFRMLDQNADGLLSADELNGKHFQGQAPPQL